MGRWTREEIASAFEHYQAQVRRAGETGDWIVTTMTTLAGRRDAGRRG